MDREDYYRAMHARDVAEYDAAVLRNQRRYEAMTGPLAALNLLVDALPLAIVIGLGFLLVFG